LRDIDSQLVVLAMAMTIALFWATTIGCSPEGEDHQETPRPENDRAPSEGVVAKVDGVSITTSRVEKLARLTKRPPAEVVDELVSFELLAREARRRGLARHRDVR